MDRVQEFLTHENVLIQTLGFDFCVHHAVSDVVTSCQEMKLPRRVTLASYNMAHEVVRCTPICIEFRPEEIAAMCIYHMCNQLKCPLPGGFTPAESHNQPPNTADTSSSNPAALDPAQELAEKAGEAGEPSSAAVAAVMPAWLKILNDIVRRDSSPQRQPCVVTETNVLLCYEHLKFWISSFREKYRQRILNPNKSAAVPAPQQQQPQAPGTSSNRPTPL